MSLNVSLLYVTNCALQLQFCCVKSLPLWPLYSAEGVQLTDVHAAGTGGMSLALGALKVEMQWERSCHCREGCCGFSHLCATGIAR